MWNKADTGYPVLIASFIWISEMSVSILHSFRFGEIVARFLKKFETQVEYSDYLGWQKESLESQNELVGELFLFALRFALDSVRSRDGLSSQHEIINAVSEYDGSSGIITSYS